MVIYEYTSLKGRLKRLLPFETRALELAACGIWIAIAVASLVQPPGEGKLYLKMVNFLPGVTWAVAFAAIGFAHLVSILYSDKAKMLRRAMCFISASAYLYLIAESIWTGFVPFQAAGYSVMSLSLYWAFFVRSMEPPDGYRSRH